MTTPDSAQTRGPAVSQSVTLTDQKLQYLIQPVLPHACQDDSLPFISSVRLVLNGQTLRAIATDRFTVAMHRIRLPEEDAGEASAIIWRGDIERVLKNFKPPKDSFSETLVKVTFGEGSVIFETTEARMTVKAQGSEYPNVDQILGKCLSRENKAGPADIALSTVFAERWHTKQLRNEPMRLYFGGGPNELVVITIGEDFIGAWMPVKVNEGDERTPLDLWGAELGTGDEQAETAA